MLLTIHNLPATTRYADIKSLLQSKCGLQHVILDNLVTDGMGKKVTVGVAEDADAAILVRKINGLYWNEQQLYVEDVRQQKTASEQPFRSANTQLQESPEQSIRSMNLQQHSSFNKPMGMPNMMAPAVQPMMAAMYYMPDYTSQDYMQSVNSMQNSNFMQSQNFDVSQKVQSAYMGISGFSQTTAQMSQVGMPFNKNQDFSQSGNKGSRWEDSYKEKEDFAGERPLFGRRMPGNNEANWFPNQQIRESPPRDRSQDNREQAWTSRGSDNRPRPTQPDFRSNIRPDDRTGLIKPRPDFRSNDRPGLLPKPRPEFTSIEGRQNQFSGRPNEFSGKANEFSGRPNEFSGRPKEHQGRSNERDGFSGRSNEFSARSNERRGPYEFSGRPNEFPGRSNEFSGRPNEFSRKSNEFSERPNEFPGRSNDRQKRPNEYQGRPNEHQARPNQYQGRPNEHQGRPNEHQGRPNQYQGRPNEHQGRPNEHQARPNEYSERRGRQNDRPEFSRPNDRTQFGRSNERNDFVRSNDRSMPRRGPSDREGRPERSKPDLTISRKRKFDDKFENKDIERPERVSRPETLRQRPPKIIKKAELEPELNLLRPMTEASKIKLTKRMITGATRKIIYEIYVNLDMKDLDLISRQAFRKLVTERLENLLGGRMLVPPAECFQIYRSMYPASEDRATYNEVLANVAKQKANEALGIVPEVAVPKPAVLPKPAPPRPAVPSKPALAPPLSKVERDANRKLQEAKQLLSQGKVPRFPQGDKRIVTQQKREEKEGHVPEVKTAYKTAIYEEVNKIIELFIHELNNAPTPRLQRVYRTVHQDGLTTEIKNNLTHSISRRISNRGLKVVRIYGCPTLPKREALEKILLRYGVLSLRKSVKAKLYTAAVDSYKNYDLLCAKEAILTEDGITVSFKPFHLAPKQKADQKMLRSMRKEIVRDMIDKSELNLLDKDWPAKEAIIKEQQAIEAEKAKKQAALEAEAKKQAAIEAEAKKQATLETKTKKQAENKKPLNTSDKIDLPVNKSSKDSNDYLNDDFHVIDEVNETDSDVEFTGDNTVVVNLDDENDDELNDVENGVDLTNEDENNDAEADIGLVNDDIEDGVGLADDVNNDVENGVGDINDFANDVELSDVLEDDQDFTADVSVDADFNIDNVDVDIDDVNDDDLEDY